MPKAKFRIIIHPRTNLKGEFTVEGDYTHLQEKFLIPKLLFDIERTLNEHVRGLRVHVSIEE